MRTYLHAIAQLAEHCSTPPDRLTEQQVRDYLILQRQKLALNSLRPILAAIKFLFRVTVPRDWPTLTATRLPKSRTVPRVLTDDKCWQIINATDKLYLRAAFQIAFTCGLRNTDVRHLRPQDVDSDRMQLRIVRSKGQHQRIVPLPEQTLRILRQLWSEHRNPNWLFPSRANLKNIAKTDQPISQRSLQRGIAQVVDSLGWQNDEIVFHTLRHSYATAMLEAGVNLKVLSRYLGHANLQATEVYLHLTRGADEKARRIVAEIMNPCVEDKQQACLEGNR